MKLYKVVIFMPGTVPDEEFEIGKNDVKELDTHLSFVSVLYKNGRIVNYNGMPFVTYYK
ncbi:MAG TPA: hypothetical protein VIM77_10335 [Mucilaginibacter sp.]